MCVSDEEVLYELLQENYYSDISESEYNESDSKINMESSCGEQNVSSDEKENVSDSSSMAYGQRQVQWTTFHLYWQAWYTYMLI
jgi:hypothetical protein